MSRIEISFDQIAKVMIKTKLDFAEQLQFVDIKREMEFLRLSYRNGSICAMMASDPYEARNFIKYLVKSIEQNHNKETSQNLNGNQSRLFSV